ncbi:MAG: helix-turn-helix domain-containing protein [Firmicutes bacterium]|nr:helix-turn-helix domain-containing protein [Bacillota bacterium]
MLDLIQIGKKLTELRQTKEFTQDDLAETMYVSHQAVSKWERGLALPSIDNLCYLMDLYSVSLEELLCLDVKIETDSLDDLFHNHQREFIIHEVVLNRVEKLKLTDIIHKLSESERKYALYLLMDHNLEISEILWPRLSLEERQLIIHKHLDGNYLCNLKSLWHLMTYNEIKKLKEKK